MWSVWFFFFLHRELHVPSCERALPEDGASSTDTVSSRNFSKASLSPLEERKEKNQNARSCERFNSVLSAPTSLSPPSFPFENILSHWAISCLSPCVISSFSIQNASSASCEHLCGKGRWNSGAISLFQDKENFPCANTPPLIRTQSVLTTTHTDTHSLVCSWWSSPGQVFCHKRQQMPLSPHQIRAGQKAGAEGSWGQAQAHVSRLRGGGQPRACLAPTGTSLRYRLHNLETPGSGSRWNNMSPTESHETNHVPANGCLLNPSSWAGGREAGRRTCWCLSAITYNKETGLCSRVTRRSVLKRWGVTDLTAVQLRLLATLLSLSLFSPPPPPEQMSSLTTFPHVHYQQHPTHTKSCTHTDTHMSLAVAPPRPPFPFPAGHNSCVTHEPDPTRDLEKVHKNRVLSGPPECVCVSMCLFVCSVD